MVHLAALLAASGEPFDPTQRVCGNRAMRALEREATLVQAGRRRGAGPDTAGGAESLCGRRDDRRSRARGSGAAALVAVPDLADGEAGRRLALARWLHAPNRGPTTGSRYDRTRWPTNCLPTSTCCPSCPPEQAIQTDHATMDRMLAELTRAAAASGAAAATEPNLHNRLGDVLDAAPSPSPRGRCRSDSPPPSTEYRHPPRQQNSIGSPNIPTPCRARRNAHRPIRDPLPPPRRRQPSQAPARTWPSR